MSARRVLAVDLGAQSGRGVVGTLDRDRLSLDVVHRFDIGFRFRKRAIELKGIEGRVQYSRIRFEFRDQSERI